MPTFDMDLSHVIMGIESSGNAHALRFESALYEKATLGTIWSTIAQVNKCTLVTARMIAYTSFGLYQIMGFNLYTLGLNVDIGDYLGDAVLQSQLFAEFLALKGINFTLQELLTDPVKMSKFATTYNGSIKYADSIRNKAAELHYD